MRRRRRKKAKLGIVFNHAGVAESADASDLSENLSARRETGGAELLKVGEPCNMAIPSQARPETAGKV